MALPPKVSLLSSFHRKMVCARWVQDPLLLLRKLPTTMRYRGGLANPVLMKPPDGTEWKVYWTNQNGEVWFQKGWKEFVEHYCLDHGHLVLFKYQGTSQIHVLILDQSALEIRYPDPPCHTYEENDNNFDQKDQGEEATQGISLNWPKEARALELARKFISCNPFFTLSLKPYNLAQSKLNVPDFKSYIENKKYVMLQIGERSWNVKLLRCHYLGSGWHLFARESELQPGDVCIFELISRKDSVFKVHVFRKQR